MLLLRGPPGGHWNIPERRAAKDYKPHRSTKAAIRGVVVVNFAASTSTYFLSVTQNSQANVMNEPSGLHMQYCPMLIGGSLLQQHLKHKKGTHTHTRCDGPVFQTFIPRIAVREVSRDEF